MTFSQTKRKREKTQINEISNERGTIPTALPEIKRIIREYNNYMSTNSITQKKQTNSYKDINYKTDSRIENLNRAVTSKQIELIFKKLPRKKNPEPDGEFYQMFKEGLTLIAN